MRTRRFKISQYGKITPQRRTWWWPFWRSQRDTVWDRINAMMGTAG